MPQYIDKESVITEIKKKRDDYINSCMSVQAHVLSDVLDFLDTLEVKEEVLDKTNKMNRNTKEVDLWRKKISNSLTKEGLFTFEDGSQAIITKIN